MSLKHLLATLQSRPGAVTIPQDAFEHLLTDVQIGRNSARATDEFYDCMEKVINELRAHPTEIEPFLKPVTKKLAADYESIITHPMDLSTVLKNVKSRSYRSKKKFASDLGLIWENALKYNNVEGHPIRAQAVFCRKLCLHLLEFVPEKPDANAPEPVQSFGGIGIGIGVGPGIGIGGGAAENGNGTVGQVALPGTNGKGVMNGNAEMVAAGEGTLTLRGRRTSGDSTTRSGYYPLRSTLGDTPAIVRTSITMRPLAIHLLPPPLPTVGPSKAAVQSGNGTAPTSRARQRTGQHQQTPAIPAWYPIAATTSTARLGDSNDAATTQAGTATAAVPEDGSTWWAMCNDIGMLGKVLPVALATALEVRERTGTRTRKRKRLPRDNGEEEHTHVISLPSIIRNNISTLATVRKRFVRLANRLSDPDAVNEESESSDAGSDSGGPAILANGVQRQRWVSPLDRSAAFAGLRRTTGAMIAHTGFEQCSTSALELCSQLVEGFVANFARSVVALRDRDGSTANVNSALQHAMLANGMTQTVDLDLYLREDLARYGARLDEAAKRLKQAFIEIDIDVEEQEIDDSEFIFGGLPGMDDMAEFLGMEIPAVPKRLLMGKKRALDPSTAASSKAHIVDPYEGPPPFAPFVSMDVPHQIGLLRAFFQAKLDEQGTLLIDEEFENAVPALGAFGQIVQRSGAGVKKKPAAEGAAGRGIKRGGGAGAGRGRGGTSGRGAKAGRGGKQAGPIEGVEVDAEEDTNMDMQE